ncbi:MAG: exodeoxyribonuclease III [Thermoplasmata archaeon]|nr:MAG: exodeoxyribonuclease III [Thermoplasmata archaeon]
MTLRLLSWNVNGIRAIARKGFLDWLEKEDADIVCLQETKARPEQLTEDLVNPPGYHAYFSAAERKGYSGTVTYSKRKPKKVLLGMGEPRFDSEGRMVVTEYRDFVLFNVYFPNGKRNQERLRYKLDFYDVFLDVADGYRKRDRGVIVCGDFNTAHKEIDLARPRENENTSGFLPIERDWMDRLISHGYTDTFREFSRGPGQYTWWDYQTRARERNVGWRLDYFFISNDLLPHLKNAFIMQHVLGSDHCPVGIVVEF